MKSVSLKKFQKNFCVFFNFDFIKKKIWKKFYFNKIDLSKKILEKFLHFLKIDLIRIFCIQYYYIIYPYIICDKSYKKILYFFYGILKNYELEIKLLTYFS